ncbi:hypothetical protein DACRYDRAFT_106196 [Dacryopinax primogenitus]|uniref:Uncharacterized protein n=1 Tax=Dacryopinax primogenitus (strain DJM 731) TaxID=1858805 RepID=M5GE65_DACPD|nr:uncharacterized protein DACRYDRAFT_106196 [Dacryopinax primogenitus]EJU03018.1 hypothetical protein DACRYDRAFT_106196 [Dacryopinax primogenitus]
MLAFSITHFLLVIPALAAPACIPSSPPAPTGAALATSTTGGVDPALVPDFGANPNPNPDGHGNCDGAVKDVTGKFILVPCDCPPPRDLFITDLSANVAAGHCINNTAVSLSFPTSSSKADQITRSQALLDTLQNLRGAGVGCPAVSTTFGVQLQQLTG